MKEELINLIKEVSKQYPYKIVGDPLTYNSYNEGWSDACDILGEKILEYLIVTGKLL
jgi:enolase